MNRPREAVRESVVADNLAKFFTKQGYKTASWELLDGGGRPDLLVYLPNDRIILIEVKAGAEGDFLEMLNTYGQLQHFKKGIKDKNPSSKVTEAVVTNMIVGENLADFFEKSGVHIIQIQDENDNLDEKLAPLLSA